MKPSQRPVFPVRKYRDYDRSIFINCSFGEERLKFFVGVHLFATLLGFKPRSALSDSRERDRLRRIVNVMSRCRFAVHDLTMVTLTEAIALPRFNMPLETGLFLGAMEYGDAVQQQKKCLILTADTQANGGIRLDNHNYVSDLDALDPCTADTRDEASWISSVWLWLLSRRKTLQQPEVNTPVEASQSDAARALNEFWDEFLPRYARSLGVDPRSFAPALQTSSGYPFLMIATRQFAQTGQELWRDSGGHERPGQR